VVNNINGTLFWDNAVGVRDCFLRDVTFCIEQSLSRLRRQLPLHKGALGGTFLRRVRFLVLFLLSDKARTERHYGYEGYSACYG